MYRYHVQTNQQKDAKIYNFSMKFLKQSEAVIDTAKILIWKPIRRDNERWKLAQNEHRKLFDALVARDPKAARLAAQEHVRNSGINRAASLVEEKL